MPNTTPGPAPYSAPTTAPYTAEKPPPPYSPEELRARIPGWGVDLDPKDRPSYPREQFDPTLNGAHWHLPEQQPEKWPRERSVEHARLTPVFGTSCPPRGLSGVIRKWAYNSFSEGQSAHWLLLLAADRVDMVESNLGSFLTTHPDNPVTETGVMAEFTHGGVRSRVGQGRNDVKHQALDPLIVATPWVVGAGLAFLVGRKLARVARG